MKPLQSMSGLLLRDSALEWWSCLQDDSKLTFAKAQSAFLDRFKDTVPAWQKLSGFFTSKQAPEEPINNYTSRMGMEGTELKLRRRGDKSFHLYICTMLCIEQIMYS